MGVLIKFSILVCALGISSTLAYKTTPKSFVFKTPPPFVSSSEAAPTEDKRCHLNPLCVSGANLTTIKKLLDNFWNRMISLDVKSILIKSVSGEKFNSTEFGKIVILAEHFRDLFEKARQTKEFSCVLNERCWAKFATKIEEFIKQMKDVTETVKAEEEEKVTISKFAAGPKWAKKVKKTLKKAKDSVKKVEKAAKDVAKGVVILKGVGALAGATG